MTFDQALIAAVAGLTGAVAFMYLQVTVALREQKNECLSREKICEEKLDALLVRVVRMEVKREYGVDDTLPPARAARA